MELSEGGWVDVLIRIASDFVHYPQGPITICRNCGMSVERGCLSHCKGLLARRALGVA